MKFSGPMSYQDDLIELKEAAEAVIDVARHPNWPESLRNTDILKCLRLRRAVEKIMTLDQTSPQPPATGKID